MVQKPKIEMLIRHYESVKTIKTKYAFPFLVALPLTLSAIITCYSLPEEKAEEVLLSMFIITLLFLFLYGTLKLFYFWDRLIFKTNDKYNYLLDILNEIYMTRYRKNYLLRNTPKRD